MTGALLETAEGVTIIGGGEFRADLLEQALALAPVLVAADGGADRALEMGHMPVAVIGDFDSLSPESRAGIPADRLHRIAEQETTDFDKCLRSVRAPLVVAVGFTGARVDHGLAALTALVRHRGGPVVLLGPEDVTFLCPPALTLDLTPGTRVSLFPFGPATADGTGLRWPPDGIGFAPWDRIGTSNEALGPVALRVAGPMLAILPRECLPQAVRALVSAARQASRGG